MTAAKTLRNNGVIRSMTALNVIIEPSFSNSQKQNRDAQLRTGFSSQNSFKQGWSSKVVKTMMEIPKEKADMSYSLWRDTKLSQDTGEGRVGPASK